jgi:hypothetical protein
MCGTGYTGALCSVCRVGYSKSGDACLDCSDSKGYAPIFVATAIIAAVLLSCVVMSCYTRKAEEADDRGGVAKGFANTAQGELLGDAQGSMDAGGDMVAGSDPMIMGKILVGLTQMLGELPGALALNFPDAFTAVLNAMKVFLFDIFEIFRLDCVQPLSLHAKFSITMMLPFVGTGIVQLLRCFADCRAGRGDADDELVKQRKTENKANSEYRMFFVIFMLYPLLSRTAFHIYSCQTLGKDEQWHMDDMAVDCAGGMHSAFMLIGLICIVVYPIGIPLTFFFLLRRDYHSCSLCTAIFSMHPKKANKKSSTVYANDTNETTTEREEKNPTESKYDFLKKDYKPEYYYFECVTLCEKLLLTGLLAFINQGSIFQCFVGACIAFAFFAVQLTFMPYADITDNVLKAVAEAQLFLTLLLSIVLRFSEEELKNDALNEDQYGTVLVVTFFSAPSVRPVAPFQGLVAWTVTVLGRLVHGVQITTFNPGRLRRFFKRATRSIVSRIRARKHL